MNIFSPLVLGGLALGLIIGYAIRHFVTSKKAGSLEQKLKRQTEEAESKAQDIIKDAKAKAIAVLDEVKKEEKEQKEKINKVEDRLLRREETLENQLISLSNRETKLAEELRKTETVKAEVTEIKSKAVSELEKISGLKTEEAKVKLFKELEDLYKQDLIVSVQKMEQERREEVEKKASEIITTAIMRYARSNVADVTTSIFHLPNEELKGKIIGREGRNIKALERATGVEIIVDETPEAIILSSFDPLRREIARMALERFGKDRRNQPPTN